MSDAAQTRLPIFKHDGVDAPAKQESNPAWQKVRKFFHREKKGDDSRQGPSPSEAKDDKNDDQKDGSQKRGK